MNISIIGKAENGYLICLASGNKYLIDEYSGDIDVGDSINIADMGKAKHICGKNYYIKNGKRYWLNIAGDLQ